MSTNLKFSKYTYIAVAILLIPAAMFSGWVISKWWMWMIVPLGASPITYWHAVGISTLIAYLKPNSPLNAENDAEIWKSIITAIITDLLWLLIGYIIHIIMIG